MQLDELINQYSNHLSENDLYIWNYIEKHKKQCENMTIEQLAEKCCVSRTTILRFTKKLSLKGFGEFKVLLKMSNKNEHNQTSKAVRVCMSYENMLQEMIPQDFREIAEQIYQAKKILVYGTGMVQRTVAKELKRLFYFGHKNFFDFGGVAECEAVLNNLEGDELLFIISLSGEGEDTLEFVRNIKIKNIPIISITKQKKNQLASLSDYNLYISTTNVEQNVYGESYESITSYFILSEMLFLRYLEYLEERSEE